MRHPLPLILVALAACASGGSQGSTRPETIRVVGGGGTSSTSINVTTSTSVAVSRLSYPIDRVWRALPAAYDSLKIPLTTLDVSRHFIGNEGMRIRQKLGTVALSQYIDCGQAQIGPSADSYEVYLVVTTTARSLSPTETEISTTVESAARPITFSQEFSRCATKGAIEARIADIVGARAGSAR